MVITWKMIDKQDLLNNLDRGRETRILTVTFSVPNIYHLATLLRLFECLEILLGNNYKEDRIKICWLFIGPKIEYVKKSFEIHYKYITKKIENMHNISDIMFKTTIKLFFSHSNNEKIRKIVDNVEFKSLEKDFPRDKEQRIKDIISGYDDWLRGEWQRRSNAFAVREQVFLSEDYLIGNMVAAICHYRNYNVILVTIDDIADILEDILKKIERHPVDDEIRSIITIEHKYFAKYPDPPKIFESKSQSTIPSFCTIISDYVNKAENAMFSVELQSSDGKSIIQLLNNRLFPEERKEEEKAICEGFVHVQDYMIKELSLII